MALDTDKHEDPERPETLEDVAMLVMGLLVAPIAIGLWGALVLMKIVNYPARLVHLRVQSRNGLPRARTGVAQGGDSTLRLS